MASRKQESPPGWEGSDLGFRWWRGFTTIVHLRATSPMNPLVTGRALCSRPGAALLNVGTCSAESPETHHCQRTFVDLRVPDPKVNLRALQKEAGRERERRSGWLLRHLPPPPRMHRCSFFVLTLLHPSDEESGASAWRTSMRVVSSIVKAKSAPNAPAGVSAPGAIPLRVTSTARMLAAGVKA